MKKVAIIGTQGIPARYGGFETLVENLVTGKQNKNIEYTVYCSSKDIDTKIKTYHGCNLKYIPLHANGIQSIPYDIISMFRSLSEYDTLLILGVSGCMFLPLLRLFCHKRIIVNIDGLEHRREKWGKTAKWFLLKSEAMAVKYADAIISDNKGIQQYVTDSYSKESMLIGYGGDHVLKDMSEERQKDILNQYNLESGQYAITVCRIEPENNCHIILEAFATTSLKLLFVGNWQHSEYGKKLLAKYSHCSNINMHSPVYDIDSLYALRNNAGIYIHGHSAGGTNPSLVEAMFFGHPILAYDCVYNRATTQNKALYFRNVSDLKGLLHTPINDHQLKEIASNNYKWEYIISQYENLLLPYYAERS